MTLPSGSVAKNKTYIGIFWPAKYARLFIGIVAFEYVTLSIIYKI